MSDPITAFYHLHLANGERKNNLLLAPCPFCSRQQEKKQGQITVFLNRASYFHGYFRCTNRCVPGGFALHFARLSGLPLGQVPGYDPDREYGSGQVDYPVKTLNQEIDDLRERLTPELLDRFRQIGVGPELLAEMRVGYNGRYLVFPYIEEDGNCYAARCVHPDRPEDSFWLGDERFFGDETQVFNQNDIGYCENGSLLVTVGEENLLALRQLGLPGIAVPAVAGLDRLTGERLRWIETIFLFVRHSSDGEAAARRLAERLGYKVRIISWPDDAPRNQDVTDLARASGGAFPSLVFDLIRTARSFSPFGSPQREYLRLTEALAREGGEAAERMRTGFSSLDTVLGGIRGINIMGGTPKAGKSCFFIQIATEMARRQVPVIYYDFENGRQKIYQRTLSRLARIRQEDLGSTDPDSADGRRLEEARHELRRMLTWFRVVTDRRLDPELMRRHIDFLRHETRSEQTLVVIDSLHKLPFKDLSERRTGIDAWLRQLEAIRDEFSVSFLVISERSRGDSGQYDEQPHMGSFKGSGDIEYSADNAMVFKPCWSPLDQSPPAERVNELWLVASREKSPGLINGYRLDFPFWGFVENDQEGPAGQ